MLTRADVETLDENHPADVTTQQHWLVRIGGQHDLITADDRISLVVGGRPAPETYARAADANGFLSDEVSPAADRMFGATFAHGLDHEQCLVRLLCHLNREALDPAAVAARRARWFELGGMTKATLIGLWHQAFPTTVSHPPIGTLRQQDLANAVFAGEYPEPPCVYCGQHPQGTGHACTHPNVIVTTSI